MRRLKELILRLLNEHRVMTIATNRPDGWPQATMVDYVNDAFLLYCFVAGNTQKYANILRDPRVSIAIGSDTAQPLDIKGLSLAGTASVVADGGEIEHVMQLRSRRFPELEGSPAMALHEDPPQHGTRPPASAGVVLLRIVPEIVCVLDYSNGFGHSDLVTFSDRDLDVHVGTARHRWDGLPRAH
jgi:nitroimidazol reductase NimA-like FMN-containing flavoprotein (pyridoxamine 5'-phosphate oxidase superfamily)